MPRGYKRNWFVIESSIIDHPKWMALTWNERSKWVVVRCLAERQPTGEFINAAHLATMLRKEGDPTPDKTIKRLIDVRLLDVNPDGTVVIHGLMEYRPGLTPADRTETERSGPKRTVEDRNYARTRVTDRQTDTNTGAPATGGSGRPRGDGETLKQYLNRIGAPVPEVATEKETMNGSKNGAEGVGDNHGKSRRRTRRDPAASG